VITDTEAAALVTRAQQIVAAGFERGRVPFPEHIGVVSPLVAAVFTLLVEESRNQVVKYAAVPDAMLSD
jgi:hypothetical protein